MEKEEWTLANISIELTPVGRQNFIFDSALRKRKDFRN
jgi:hypothetical protein